MVAIHGIASLITISIVAVFTTLQPQSLALHLPHIIHSIVPFIQSVSRLLAPHSPCLRFSTDFHLHESKWHIQETKHTNAHTYARRMVRERERETRERIIQFQFSFRHFVFGIWCILTLCVHVCLRFRLRLANLYKISFDAYATVCRILFCYLLCVRRGRGSGRREREGTRAPVHYTVSSSQSALMYRSHNVCSVCLCMTCVWDVNDARRVRREWQWKQP